LSVHPPLVSASVERTKHVEHQSPLGLPACALSGHCWAITANGVSRRRISW
jgi:hypothetical protein